MSATRAWQCPGCGRSFGHANQWHSCRPLVPLDDHFAGKARAVRKIFDSLLRALGPKADVRVSPVKSSISFQAPRTFAAFKARKAWLDGELVLNAPVQAPVFHKVWRLSAAAYVHQFRLRETREVTPLLKRLLREAHARARGEP